jgi:hypothetical protein
MISILGIGHVSACGIGLEALRKVCQGAAVSRVGSVPLQTPNGETSVVIHPARPDGLDQRVNVRKLRRLDRFAQMALLSALLAIEDAGDAANGERTGILFSAGHGPLGSSFAFQDGIQDGGDKEASPAAFTNSVHNMPSSQVAIALGCNGPCLTLSAAEQSPAVALVTAERWLERGEVDRVLLGFGDELSALTQYAAACLSQDGEYQPGEGFVCLLLGKNAETTTSCVESVQIFDTPEAAQDAIFDANRTLLANKNGCNAPLYERLLGGRFTGQSLAAYFGNFATGQGFDLAAAALMLRDQPEKTIACAQCENDGKTWVIRLKG